MMTPTIIAGTDTFCVRYFKKKTWCYHNYFVSENRGKSSGHLLFGIVIIVVKVVLQ